LSIDSNPKIWEIVNKFEEWISKEKEWKVSRFYDLIQIGNKYHKFIWTQNFHPETFKKILSRQSCSLGDHLSYRTVRVSYLAWILNETPRPMVWKLIKETPCLSKRVAIYSLSKALIGMPNCLKLNETESVVLDEFEKFLAREYGIKPQSFFGNNARHPIKCVIDI
jgi:hypothetical protein